MADKSLVRDDARDPDLRRWERYRTIALTLYGLLLCAMFSECLYFRRLHLPDERLDTTTLLLTFLPMWAIDLTIGEKIERLHRRPGFFGNARPTLTRAFGLTVVLFVLYGVWLFASATLGRP